MALQDFGNRRDGCSRAWLPENQFLIPQLLEHFSTGLKPDRINLVIDHANKKVIGMQPFLNRLAIGRDVEVIQTPANAPGNPRVVAVSAVSRQGHPGCVLAVMLGDNVSEASRHGKEKFSAWAQASSTSPTGQGC